MRQSISPLVVVTAEPYEPTEFARQVSAGDAGALVTFTGLCRSEDGRLSALELEHYPSMAEKMLRRMAESCIARHDLSALAVLHRSGLVHVGEPIVTVVAAARHRAEAFDGAMQLMDFLKTDAPFWKREHPVGGAAGRWVGAVERDDRARRRWDTTPES